MVLLGVVSLVEAKQVDVGHLHNAAEVTCSSTKKSGEVRLAPQNYLFVPVHAKRVCVQEHQTSLTSV